MGERPRATTDDGTIEWEDPPVLRYEPKPSRADLRAAMTANPGRWLVWSRHSTRANASNIRHRYPDLEVEWHHNAPTNDDGTDRESVTIYTRLPVR